MPHFSVHSTWFHRLFLGITKDLEVTLDPSLLLNPQIPCKDSRGLEIFERTHKNSRRYSCKTSNDDRHWRATQAQIPQRSYVHKDTFFFSLNLSVKICLTNYGFRTVQGRSSQQGHLCLFGHRAKLGCLTNPSRESH